MLSGPKLGSRFHDLFSAPRLRGSRHVAAGLALAMVASLLVGMPAQAGAVGTPDSSEPSVPVVAGAPVKPTAGGPPPAFARPTTSWPTVGSATLDVAMSGSQSRAAASPDGSASIGGLPVRVSAGTASGHVADFLTSRGPVAGDGSPLVATASRVAVSVLDREKALQLGVGVLLTATRADGLAGPAPVTFEADYSRFGFAYGADYGKRLRLVQLPSCALTEPTRRECAFQRPFSGSHNDTSTSTVVATIDVAAPLSAPTLSDGGNWTGTAEPAAGKTLVQGAGAQPVVLALASSSSSDSGDFSASTLNQAFTWASGSNSGDFTTTVPLAVPQSPGGVGPEIALQYSSGMVDGLTKSTNTQAPWTGEGWNLAGVSFVERSYRPCRFDGVSYSGGDQCWVSGLPVSIVLNGQATRIMDNSGNGLKAEDDSLGWKVERFSGASGSPGNGARDGEYFKVTTMDGTQYFFGYRDRSAKGGVQRVEVFGNNPGEPCYIGSNFGANHCPQAYRWNLDYVVDRLGNTMTYNWDVYEGNYGLNLNAQAVTYDITSTLAYIDYGQNINVAGSANTGTVSFTRGFRCFYGDCAHNTNDPSVWMDTPWDQHCDTWKTSCPGLYAPTFWTLYKLDEIKSHAWDASLNSGAGGWSVVDFIAPSYGFPSTGDYISPTGDDTSPSLWAWKIWLHNRPPIDIGGIRLINRVFWGNDLNRAPMTHWRVEWLTSGSGQRTTVTYSPEECTRTNVYDGQSDRNPRRCFPQWEDDQYRWYHKYVTTDVTVEDTVGRSTYPVQRWHYDYSTAAVNPQTNAYGLALWHYDDNWMVPASQRAFSQWRGYTNVRTTHTGGTATASSGPRQVTEDIYFRGMNGDRTTAGGWGARSVIFTDGWDHNITDHEAMQGKLRRTMTFDGTSGPWTSATRHLHTITQTGGQYMGGGTPDLKAWRILETTTLTQTVLAGPAYRLRQLDTAYDADYPLPTLIKDHGDVLDTAAGTADDRCTVISYVAPDTTRNLIEFPKHTLNTTCAATLTAADYLAGQQYFYDGQTTPGVLGTGADAKALPTKSTALKAPTAAPPINADFVQATRANYDSYGRVLDAFNALDYKTSTVYTPTSGIATTIAVTTPPPTGTGAGFTTTTTFDPRWGTPTRIVDPNGKITVVEYDVSGRQTKVWKHNRAAAGTTNVVPDIEYGYVLRDTGPNYVTTKQLGPAGVALPESYTVYDGLLRKRRVEAASGMSSGRTVGDIEYDQVGNVWRTATLYNSSVPNSNLDLFDYGYISNSQVNTYDNLHRKTSAQQLYCIQGQCSTQSDTRYAYDGDKTTMVTAPVGGTSTSTVVDIWGQVRQLRQHSDGNPASTNYIATNHSYDRLGRLTQATDPAGKAWTYTYSPLGQKTQASDPDAGTALYDYDDAGQLTSTTDARGQKLYYSYDRLGRKTHERDGSPTGDVLSQWVYDDFVSGQLGTTIRHVGSDQYKTRITSRDHAYRPLHAEVEIPNSAVNGALAATYSYDYTYKANGAPATIVLPEAGGLPGETMTFGYSANGLPKTLNGAWTGGSQTYVSDIAYSFDGLTSWKDLGPSGSRVRLYNSFHSSTRLLTLTDVQAESPPGTFTSKFSTTYTYDAAGNIKTAAGKTNAVADQQECFDYDYLRRMRKAWTQVSGACTTPQRTGADPYWREWSIDDLGNRTQQIDKDPTAGDTTWNYTIAGNSCGTTGKAHQLTAITGNGPKFAAPRTFCYDPAGNTTTATTETGGAQTLTWDKQGHLGSLAAGTDTSSYLYDADGKRLIARTPSRTTLYLPDGTELDLPTSGGPVLGTRYYQGIAVRDAAGLKWTATNHQNTSIVQIDAATLAASRRRLMPYGEDRTVQPGGWTGTKGYVGGTKDNTGLTHLGAREYDSTIGRFISKDAITNWNDTQQAHGYSYSNNNPVTLSDPDGDYPCCAPAAPGTRPAGWNWKHEMLDFLSWFPIIGDAAMTIDAQIWRDEGRPGRAEELEGYVRDGAAIDMGLPILPPTITRIGKQIQTGLAARAGRSLEVRAISIVQGARFELGEIRYGTTGLSKIAYEYRLRNAVPPGQNIAVYVIDLGKGKHQVVVAPNVPGKEHSEQVINAYLKEQGFKPEQVVAIYSERSPCPDRCAPSLVQFTNAQNAISWSYPDGYGTGNRAYRELDMAVRLGRI